MGGSESFPAQLRPALAAVFSQKREKVAHAVDLDGVNDVAALPGGDEQAGAVKLFEMEG